MDKFKIVVRVPALGQEEDLMALLDEAVQRWRQSQIQADKSVAGIPNREFKVRSSHTFRPWESQPDRTEVKERRVPEEALGLGWDAPEPPYQREIVVGEISREDAEKLVGCIWDSSGDPYTVEQIMQLPIKKVLAYRDMMTGKMATKVHATDHNGDPLLYAVTRAGYGE